jgi:hypothetical protein
VVSPDYWRPIGGRWHLWKDVELRGAGFPCDWLRDFGDEGTTDAAHRWLEAEATSHAARRRLLEELGAAIGRAVDGETRKALITARARVMKHREVDAELLPDGLAGREALSAWEASRASLAGRWTELEAAWAVFAQRASARLREIAQAPIFREALLWQNRAALHTGIASLLRRADGSSTAKTRQNELRVASYVQRYCAKNDRIGFFGPHAWAWLTESGPNVSVAPGADLVGRRFIRLEAWAIHALGDRLAADPELKVELAPRLMPNIRLEGTVLCHSVGRRSELPTEYARLLEACDGHTSARDIAAKLVADGSLDLADPDDVYGMLDELVGKQVVVWTVDTPTCGGRPEDLLRAELTKLAAGPARQRALDALAELEVARDEVGRAAGSPGELDAALGRLEQTFTRLTGVEALRNQGQTYAGRTPVFELCHRAVSLEVGPGVWQQLAAPLRLILQSARWFTWEISSRYRRELLALYRRLRADADSPRVDYLRVAASLPELFTGAERAGSIVDQVRRDLAVRWTRILDFNESERIVRRSAPALEADVLEVFAAPGPGWPAARHHSIDLLLAAGGPEAFATGDFFAVLGEIHPGLNTHLLPDLPHPYGERDVLFERRDQEIGRPCVAPVWSRNRTHFDYYSRSPNDYDVEHAAARSWRPRDHVLAAADLIVEEIDGELWVGPRDRALRFEAIPFFEHHLIAESYQQFGLVGGAGRAHVPRVEIDGLVVARERWSFAPADVDFASVDDQALRFARARAWALRLGLPRFGFLRTPEEVKPTYVDLESPTYVDLAARLIRAASAVSFSEMLPGFDGCWLPDAQGRRYTSELRMVAVDPQVWTRPSIADDHRAT